MVHTSQMTRLLSVFLFLGVAMLSTIGCKENAEERATPEQSFEASTGEKSAGAEQGTSCEKRVTEMVELLETYSKHQPEIEVPFELPEASGRTMVDGFPVLAGPTMVRVGDKTFTVPDGSNPVEDGEYPDDMLAKIQEAVAAAEAKHKKERRVMRNPKAPFVVNLGAHPDMPAGAIEPFFADIDAPRGFMLLAFESAAPEMPERPVDEDVEPMIQELEGTEDKAQIKERMTALDERVAGDCDIAFLRAKVSRKMGDPVMTHRELLGEVPLKESVLACGCDEVDIDGLEAVLAWAERPPHPRVVVVPKKYDAIFGSADAVWSDVVAQEDTDGK